MSISCSLLGAALSALVLPAVLRAQRTGDVRGQVHDAVTGRPLVGAVVTVGVATTSREARTDEGGAFLLRAVPVGQWSFTARRLGYESERRSIAVPTDSAYIFRLSRITALDTVRVRAARQGIYGVVATMDRVGGSSELRALPGATVHILGGDIRKVTVDSSGHFFVSLKAAGAYLLRGEAPGFVPQPLSVTVPTNDGVEVAFLLDSARGAADRMLAEAYQDLERRMLRRRLGSVLVSRIELTKHGHAQLGDAVRSSRSFSMKGLRLDDEVCLFIDGRPRPGVRLDAIEPERVEAVEIYTAASDASRTLADAWPRGMPCAGAGFRATGSFSDNVRWVSVWTRR